MHKGPVYELWQEYRTFCGEYPYPLWSPAAWKITTATWAGTAAALAPGTPLYLTPTGIDGSLRACYECVLWDNGGGDHAILTFKVSLINPISVTGLIGGDWGIHGSISVDGQYVIPQPWSPLSSFFNVQHNAGDAYLRPTRLTWQANPY